MMSIITYLLIKISIIFCYLNNKTVVLPFSKISIGNIGTNNNEENILSDMINYNIYTKISIGTPPQSVAHFIEPQANFFEYKYKSISNINNTSINYENLYKSKQNFFYSENSSSTFKNHSDDPRAYTDIIYFNESLKTNFSFVIYYFNRPEKYKTGCIGLSAPIEFYDLDERDRNYFIYQLKHLQLIEDYIWTVNYENKDLNYNFKDDDIIGKITFGKYPHKYSPNIYNEDEMIQIYSKTGSFFQGFWTLSINQVKFNLSDVNSIEGNSTLEFNILSSYIIGTKNYQTKIESKIFEDLINQKKCKKEIIKENINQKDEYSIYSCDNDKSFYDNYIKKFPELYFVRADNEIYFMFFYKDLFKLINNRWYFMIIFNEQKTENTNKWIMGEVFLRKYVTSFNIDAKTLIFYKNQIDSKNKENQNDNNDNEEGSNKSVNFRIIIEIVMAVVIVILVILLAYKISQKTRKKRANELDDNNYEYTSGEGENKLFEADANKNE